MADLVDQVLAERRRRTSSRGFLGGLITASLLHLSVLLSVVLLPTGERQVPTEYVNVRVVPLAALGTPKPPVPRPQPPEPQPPEPQPEAPTPPAPEPEPATKPSPAEPEPAPRATAPVLPQAKPQKPQSEPRVAAPADEPATDAAPVPPQRAGSAQGSVAGTSAFGTLEGIDPDFTYDYYLDRMLALIHAQWLRPPAEGEVKAVVRFVVSRSGEITDLELAEPSGFNAFDLAALRAVQNASPLPRLPASYRRDSLQVTLIVR